MNKYEKEAGEYADKASFRVPFDGSNKFYDDNHFKWAKEAYLAACEAREKEMQEKDRRIGELEQWKKEAMEVMPDYQKIGQLLGINLGESVHDKIVPGIEKMKEALKWYKARATLSGNGEEGGGDAVGFDDFLDDAVQAYFVQSMKELSKESLGDIERKNWERVREKCQQYFNQSKH